MLMNNFVPRVTKWVQFILQQSGNDKKLPTYIHEIMEGVRAFLLNFNTDL